MVLPRSARQALNGSGFRFSRLAHGSGSIGHLGPLWQVLRRCQLLCGACAKPCSWPAAQVLASYLLLSGSVSISTFLVLPFSPLPLKKLACAFSYVCGGQRSSLGAIHLMRQILSLGPGVTDSAWLTGQHAPETSLFPSLLCWGCKLTTPCLAFSVGARI